MNRRYSNNLSQPIIATTEAELQMYINNALKNSRKPVVITENSDDSNQATHHLTHSHNNQSAYRTESLNYDNSANLKNLSLPLEQYQINNDSNYEIIRKKSNEVIQHTQNITLKYLKPPPLPPSGDLIIRQEADVQMPAAPPLIVREPAAPALPQKPIVIREEPPRKPPVLPQEEIVVPGKVLPPPPRQKIIEKLPQVPAPPPPVLIERWLGYPEQVRNVRFFPGRKLAPLPAPKNLVIKWDSPSVQVRHQLNYRGVTIADPDQYRAKHGSSLLPSHMLPPIANEFTKNVPAGEVLGVHSSTRKPRLVGDVHALALLNSRIGKSTISNAYYQNNGYSTSSAIHSASSQPITISSALNYSNSEPIISELSQPVEYADSGNNGISNIITESSAAYASSQPVSITEPNFMFEEQNNPFHLDEIVNSEAFEN